MPKSHDSVASSLGATRGTYQGLHAIRASKGTALQITDDELLAWQARLAATEGLYGEPSSLASVAAVERLRAGGVIGAAHIVVAVMTAGGLKDVAPTARRHGEVPVVAADIDAAMDTLRSVYGFRAGG
jgi:threonine synthase